MLKLKRYLKPYIGLMILAVVLLFGQAMLELTLPNYMSDIVNIGIQKGGISEVAPKAIGADSLTLMTSFMPESDKELVQKSYRSKADLTENEWNKIVKTYTNADEKNAVVLDSSLASEDKALLDTAFNRASYALITLVQEMAGATGGTGEVSDTTSMTFDVEKLNEMIPMLAMIPNETIQKVVDEAKAAPEMLISTMGAVFTKSFYQQLGADTDQIQTNYIAVTGFKMLFLGLLIVICAVGVGLTASRTGAAVARDLRRDVFGKVTSFTNNEYDHFSTASLITRTTNDVTQVQNFVTMGLRMLCFAPIMGIGGIVMALRKSSSMAWIIGVAVLVIIGVMIILFTVALPRFTKMQKFVDKLNLVSRESLAGMMVIRAFSNEKFEEKRFDKANDDLTSNTLFVNRAMATMMPVISLVMNGMMLAIVWIGGHKIAESTMQVGDMMAYIQYSMQVIMSFIFISMMFIMIPRASVSCKRISEVLDSESSVKDSPNAKEMSKHPRGVVEFHNVSFRYEGASENVLENISFTAKPGQTTAFIGSTGSGKSTLINLLPRFYDASEGKVTIDGVDVRNVTMHALRETIGYVPQKGMLFSGDISSNLKYGDENATPAALKEAADVAQATEFIDNLDDGYDTSISQGGTNVSGGQRQRLSIARALVKKAPIYIFDDTFSALDFKTDAKLRRALKGYTGDATVLVVAQRVSTIMSAEQIVVLEEGKIVGIGTHSELLANCKTYREIAESQLSKEELA